MRKLRIGVIDLVTKITDWTLWGRVMFPNLAGIMSPVVATWCERAGHDVTLLCYTGREDLLAEFSPPIDVIFISTFTEVAQLSYALSALFRARGAVTVIGGPHARCYPQDCQKYFDYVLGFTDEALVLEVLRECAPHRPEGLSLNAASHPKVLPSLRERWKFVEPTLRRAPFIKIVPLVGSLGCPYSCSFCIDSTVPYQLLDYGVMQDDLRFLLARYKRPNIAWHDPNFGIRFDDCMDAIEHAVPAGHANFIAESSLSLLTEPHLTRLKRNGFKALLPGIESWHDLGNKSRTGKVTGAEKVAKVAAQVNLILRYVPYVQTNLIFGLDVDRGDEPFALTKDFLDRAPGAFPGYSLMSAFGQAAPLNLELQRAGRVLPFPFHFLNNNHAMNVRPLHYSWPEFYDHLIDVTRYSFSPRRLLRRFAANGDAIPRVLNLVRAVSTEGYGRERYFREVRRRLDSDRPFRRFFEQETTEIPEFFVSRVRKDLGPYWQWLPKGALSHDPNAYLAAQEVATAF